MRRALLGSAIAFLGLGASAASADVTVLATIDKTKEVSVFEDIFIFKDVFLDVFVDADVTKAAESDAIINQVNRLNEACSNCDEKTDLINNSGNNNAGILTINQSAGNMNNQGNAIASAIDLVGGGPGDPPPPNETDPGFAESQAAVDQLNGGAADVGNLVDAVNIVFRNARIIGSLNGNTGILHVNQSAGNMANQANALSLAISRTEQGVALAEADLGQVNTFNDVLESDLNGGTGAENGDSNGTTIFVGINKLALLRESVNGNQGIVGVNQTAGNMANQGNVVSASFIAPFTAPSTPTP